MELPDFHIDHAEKIDWMIDTEGFAVEPVPMDLDSDPPRAGYTYTIGLTAHVGFPEVVVFGMKPAQARNLLVLVRNMCQSGTEIPLDVEVVGLLDHDLRCRFAHVDLDDWGPLFTTGAAWYQASRSSSSNCCIRTRTASCRTRPGSTSTACCPNR